MIGYFDYTTILTYLSLASAGVGIMVTLHGTGHPFLGIFFLLFCGLCDAFDGKVARLKKDRTDMQRKFGIQIDSLADVIAFGVLPACIGNAMLRISPNLEIIPNFKGGTWYGGWLTILLFAIMIAYILMALVRLAYFNVTEEERQETETGVRKTYTGLPVTSASLIFPLVVVLQVLTDVDLTWLYFIVMAATAALFVSKVQIPKPGMRGILIMVGIGALEFALLLIPRFL